MPHELMAFDNAELFASICAHALAELGSGADAALIAGVTHYGQGRGTRMRLRAQRDGYALDPESYTIYGEFIYGPGESARRVDCEEGRLVNVNLKCPWVTLWDEKRVPDHIRRYYCDRIDVVIFDAFMNGAPYTMTNIATRSRDGTSECRFGVQPSTITPERMGELEAIRRDNAASILMPWDYHVAHLYHAMKRGMERQVGHPLDELFAKAVDDCTHNPQALRDTIARHSDTDWFTLREPSVS